MKIFRGRDLSSSQKKTRCQRPSIKDPSTIGIACEEDDSRLLLGRWQRVFFCELDRSRPRKIFIQVIGE